MSKTGNLMQPIKIVGGGPIDGETRYISVALNILLIPRASKDLSDRFDHAYVRMGLDLFAYDGIREREAAPHG